MLRRWAWMMLIGAVASGCGDDGEGGAGASGGADEGGAPDGGAPEGGAGDGGSANGGGGSTGDGGAGGSTPDTEALAYVRGSLFTEDLGEAQAYHDQLAAGGEQPAKDAGDFAHDTFLGTALLGTTPDQFLGIDRWSSDDNMDAFYGDPGFQEAFAGLFSAPPTFETFHRSTFYGWGDLDAGDAGEPHYVVVVRGRLAAEPGDIVGQHDAIAMAGEEPAQDAGDLAHVVYLGRQDDREVIIFDVWSSDENIEAFYSDPGFQEAFQSLFDGPPTIGVFASNEWHQW